MNILCTICARGGSKGVKGKNARLVNGIPLIAYTIKVAQQSGLFSDIVVSTDDDDIARAAEQYGGSILFERPPELATDSAAKLPVIQHAFTESEKILDKKFDILFDLDTTSPLRNVDDLKGCFAMINSGKYGNIVTASPARRSPYFNLIETDENGTPSLSKPSNLVRRQQSPDCFDMNASIYVWTRDAILAGGTLFLENTGLFVMPEERSWDVDTEFDFSVVKMLLEQRND